MFGLALMVAAALSLSPYFNSSTEIVKMRNALVVNEPGSYSAKMSRRAVPKARGTAARSAEDS